MRTRPAPASSCVQALLVFATEHCSQLLDRRGVHRVGVNHRVAIGAHKSHIGEPVDYRLLKQGELVAVK